MKRHWPSRSACALRRAGPWLPRGLRTARPHQTRTGHALALTALSPSPPGLLDPRGGYSATCQPDTLIAISDACHRHERLRLEYTNFQGRQSIKDVEPHSVVNFTLPGIWSLIPRPQTGVPIGWTACTLADPPARLPPREAPEGDVVTYLSHQLSARAWPHRATVTLHRSAAELADRIWPGMGVLPARRASCLLHIGADSLWALSWMITPSTPTSPSPIPQNWSSRSKSSPTVAPPRS